jgi:hypothetical protein
VSVPLTRPIARNQKRKHRHSPSILRAGRMTPPIEDGSWKKTGSVPMKESLATEHSSELLRNTLEHLLDSSGISDKVDSHLQSLGRNIADRGLDVVWDPFNP